MRSAGYSPDQPTIFHLDRARMAGKTIIAALLLGVCFLGFWGQVGTGKISPAKELLLWIAFGTGAAMLMAVAFKIFDFRPAVEVSARGLLARDISPDLIPWNGIVEVGIREFKRTQMIEVRILPGTLRSIRLTKRHSMGNIFNRMLGFPHYYIVASILDHNADHVLSVIRHQKRIATEADKPLDRRPPEMQ